MEIKNSALLLASSDFSMASSLKSALRDKGYELIYVNSFESFIDHVVLTKDCIIFIDKKRFRFLRIIKALVEKCSFFREHMIVYLTDEEIVPLDIENGSVLAFNYHEILQNLTTIIRKAELNKNLPTSFAERDIVLSVITDFLIHGGVSPKYVGFDYIIQIVLMSVENNFVLNKLQKDVYPKISLMFKVPICNIERNIRSVIQYLKRTGKFEKILLSVVGRIPTKLTTKTFLRLILLYVETEVGRKIEEKKQADKS